MLLFFFPWGTLGVFLHCPSLYFLRQDCSLNLKFTNWLDHLASKLPESTCPPVYLSTPSSGVPDAHCCASLHVDTGDPNLDPPAWHSMLFTL